MAFLRNLMGSVLKFIYEGVATILPNEPSSISYLAISIIIISIIFKVVMFPIFLSSIKNQKIQAKFAKEQQKIREKYKHDPQAMNLKLMEFNKEHGIKQLGGCLPMIFNLILVLAMFAVMREPLLYIFGDANANVITVTIQSSNDTLWHLAQKHLGDGTKWKEIAKARNISDPRKLKKGQKIKIPLKKGGAKS